MLIKKIVILPGIPEVYLHHPKVDSGDGSGGPEVFEYHIGSSN